MRNQAGQTLIETMVAMFILVMGIAAAVGLANYALSASGSVNKQLIAMGLAREGMEAVKNMRDTNWLKTPLSATCFDFYSQTNTSNCYTNWLNGTGYSGYNIDPGTTSTYILKFDQATISYWSLVPEANKFGLNYSTSTPGTGFYNPGIGVLSSAATSDFSRSITISKDTSFSPFNNASLGGRVKVTVNVWWKDKHCPVSDTVPSSTKCKVTLNTYLTNWKNY